VFDRARLFALRGRGVTGAGSSPSGGELNVRFGMPVPFGGVFQHRWWYKLWASFGIRNRFQAGLSAGETADYNAFFMSEATRYITTSCYRVIFREVGFQYRFAEQEFFDSHDRPSMRAIGKLGSPAMRLYRIFRSRIVYLRKPDSPKWAQRP
jgi:hypothetical protein